MFCPKCAAKNEDNLTYCRECGENLKIISQAMEKTFPHVLASKVDAAIEKKNGRLIRAAVTTGIFGTLYSAYNFFTPTDRHSLSAGFPFLLFVLPGYFFLMSVYYILTYRRAMELDGRVAHLTDAEDVTKALSVFCPKCRVLNDKDRKSCQSCGQNLVFRPSGLARFLPTFILRILDGGVARNEAVFAGPRSRLGIAITTVLMFVLAGYFAFIGESWMTLLIVFLGLVNVITNGWDYLTYKRTVEEKFGDVAGDHIVQGDNDSKTSGLAVHDTKHLGAFIRDMQNLPVGDEPLSFDVENTRPLEPAQLSVTEETTRPLPTGTKIFDDEAPTTQKLDSDAQ